MTRTRIASIFIAWILVGIGAPGNRLFVPCLIRTSKAAIIICLLEQRFNHMVKSKIVIFPADWLPTGKLHCAESGPIHKKIKFLE